MVGADMSATEPPPHQQSVVGEKVSLLNEDSVPGGHCKEMLRPRKTVDYRDKRAWNRRALLASYLGTEGPDDLTLAEDAEIEFASTDLTELTELTENQRRVVSTASDLDGRAPFTQVLDFLEEVLLALASGSGSEESVLTKVRQLLGASGDILKIMGTLRALVADFDKVDILEEVPETEKAYCSMILHVITSSFFANKVSPSVLIVVVEPVKEADVIEKVCNRLKFHEG